jgi:hypothetical protein
VAREPPPLAARGCPCVPVAAEGERKGTAGLEGLLSAHLPASTFYPSGRPLRMGILSPPLVLCV